MHNRQLRRTPLLDELVGRPVIETAVRPFLVVLQEPGRDLAPGVPQVAKPTDIPRLIAEPSVEALRVRVLNRLAGLDVSQFDALIDIPRQEVPPRLAPFLCPSESFPGIRVGRSLCRAHESRACWQRCVHFQCQALAREGVHDRQHPQRPATGQPVAHQVDGPLLVRPRGHEAR